MYLNEKAWEVEPEDLYEASDALKTSLMCIRFWRGNMAGRRCTSHRRTSRISALLRIPLQNGCLRLISSTGAYI